MKLSEMYKTQPIFAWLEPSQGPEDIMGVRLAFIEPIKPKIQSIIDDASNKKDTKRAEMMELRLQNYLKQGQTYFTPSLGWWMSEEDFHQGKEGFSGAKKGNVYSRYPDLQVLSSRKEAETAAKKAGII